VSPMLRSQVTHLSEKTPFPSVLCNLTLFQYGGLAQWSGSRTTSSHDPSFHPQRPYFQLQRCSEVPVNMTFGSGLTLQLVTQS
jgi:hypothetical protein